MLNNKVTVVANPARRMEPACALASARGFRLRLARSALAVAVASLLPLYAAAQVGRGAVPEIEAAADTARDFDLPAGSLAVALEAFSTKSGIRLDSHPRLLADRQARAVSGRMDWSEALSQLLQGSGLEYRQTGGTTVVIVTAGEGAASADGPIRARPETTKPQVATTLEAITVTGTRIRGGTTPSPMITIGSEQIQEEGFTDLGEVIRSVPQNFTGGQNPGVFMGNMAGAGLANQNITGGSSLNLRGLGPDASLTLLNGHRMVYGGFSQAVDVSAIPVEVVERIEIVPDGASAIYGSDAVGGVANVILKRDFHGLALGARYGTATNGGLTTREYTATAGGAWSSGGLIASYKDSSIDPIYARQRNYTAHLLEPSTIYPGMGLRSGLISAHQSVGEAVELRVDALRTERDQIYYFYLNTPLIYDEMAPETTTTLVSPSMEVSLPHNWLLTVGATWGKDERTIEQLKVTAATGATSTLVHNCHCNESRSYELGVEGPLFTLPGGDARLAMGAGYRENEYANPNYMTGTVPIQNEEGARFAYAEFDLPLIDPESRVAGVRRLVMTAAARTEDYDSLGRVTTPKLGLIYAPAADFTVKASWGKSFKAPTLLQWAQPVGAGLRLPAQHGSVGYDPDERVLLFTGGNPDLEPEHARTWAASLAFHPVKFPGLEAELTWFDIDYTDRVVQPILSYAEALVNPIYAEFIEYSPTAERQAELLAIASTFSNVTGAPYDPGSVVAIIDGRFVNATRQRIKGFDLSGSYRFDLGGGLLTIRGSASWLNSTQQTKGVPAPYDLAGTLHNPAKVNSRIGATWNHGGFSASAFANYTSGVINFSDGVKGASFATVDGTFRYSMREGDGAWSGVDFALSANNVLNRSPPLYMPISAYVPPYDSTSYSAIGRFLSLSVSKRW